MISKEIFELIKKYDDIIIHHHVNPDPDCIGSQLGLKYLIEKSFPKKNVYAVGSHNEKTEFLGKLDRISDKLYQNALVILVDVGDKNRVDDSRFNKGKQLIKIDHHPQTEVFCDIEWVDTTYSSCCEMIIDLYLNNKSELVMTNEAARCLYAGLITDTGRYYYQSVSPRTFNLGADVYQYNFDKQALYADIYYKSIKELQFKGHVLENFLYTKNGLGYMKIDANLLKKFSLSPEYVASEVNILSDIKEIKMWIFFIEYQDINKIRVEFRSREVPVNELAKKYRGGGHKLASGAMVNSWEEVDMIIEDADNLCK